MQQQAVVSSSADSIDVRPADGEARSRGASSAHHDAKALRGRQDQAQLVCFLANGFPSYSHPTRISIA